MTQRKTFNDEQAMQIDHAAPKTAATETPFQMKDFVALGRSKKLILLFMHKNPNQSDKATMFRALNRDTIRRSTPMKEINELTEQLMILLTDLEKSNWIQSAPPKTHHNPCYALTESAKAVISSAECQNYVKVYLREILKVGMPIPKIPTQSILGKRSEPEGKKSAKEEDALADEMENLNLQTKYKK